MNIEVKPITLNELHEQLVLIRNTVKFSIEIEKLSYKRKKLLRALLSINNLIEKVREIKNE